MARAELVFGLNAAFLAGIFLAGTEMDSLWYAGPPLLLLLCGFRRMISLVFLIVLGFLAGIFYYHLRDNITQIDGRIPWGTPIEFEGVLYSDPIPTRHSTILEVILRKPLSGRVIVFTDQDIDFSYGNLLAGKGTFRPSPDGGLPSVRAGELRVAARGEGYIGIQFLRDMRNRIVEHFSAILPSDEAALLSGLTFGVRSQFSTDLKEAMRASGTTHLVALSGYNIGLVLFAVALMCGRWLSRKLTLIASAVFIILFVAFSGASPSIVRAAIMGILMLLAELWGRLYSFRHAAVFAAMGMAVLDPRLVAHDIGFQLSFLSLFGVVYVAPLFSLLLRAEGAGGWRGILAGALGAQVAVIPVIVFYFGGFSPLSTAANILILPFVPYIMFFGFAIALAGFISYWLTVVLGLLVAPLLKLLLAVIYFFGGIDSPLSLGFDRPEAVMLYYILLTAIIWRFQRTRVSPNYFYAQPS